jgi:hypothetical protein
MEGVLGGTIKVGVGLLGGSGAIKVIKWGYNVYRLYKLYSELDALNEILRMVGTEADMVARNRVLTRRIEVLNEIDQIINVLP